MMESENIRVLMHIKPLHLGLGFILLGSAFIVGCIYYDRMRHKDPAELARRLRSSRKRNALTANHRHISLTRTGENKIVDSRNSVSNHLTAIPSRRYRELLINELSIAENMMTQQNHELAVVHFATAIAMAHDPTHIIKSLRRSLPPLLYNDLARVLNTKYNNNYSFMYEDWPQISKIKLPAPHHSLLF